MEGESLISICRYYAKHMVKEYGGGDANVYRNMLIYQARHSKLLRDVITEKVKQLREMEGGSNGFYH